VSVRLIRTRPQRLLVRAKAGLSGGDCTWALWGSDAGAGGAGRL